MIKVLHMEEKINAPVETLSGGQRRKLSVGIALISGSKVHNYEHLHKYSSLHFKVYCQTATRPDLVGPKLDLNSHF